jgi:hypothetical protein
MSAIGDKEWLPYARLQEGRPQLRIAVLLPEDADATDEGRALVADLLAAPIVGECRVFRVADARAADPEVGLSPLWRAYYRLDARLGRNPLVDLPEAAPLVSERATTAQIASGRWDVLLCPVFSPRFTELAPLAMHGLWWVSVDPEPASRPDAVRQLHTMAAGRAPFELSLWRLTPELSRPQILERASTRQISGISPAKNRGAIAPLRRHLWMSALERLQRTGKPRPMAPADTTHRVADDVSPEPSLLRLGARQWRHRQKQRNRVQAWQVGFRPLLDGGAEYASPANYRWIETPQDGWLADPCAIDIAGRTWLFMEKFNTTRGLGEIVCCEIRADGSVGDMRSVLLKPYHLSYPQVFIHAGEIYMVPEAGGACTVDLYRATDFPWSWEPVRVLFRGPAYDTTVLHHDNRFWFFTSLVEGVECVDSRLLLFTSERLDGDWKLHPASPLSMDARWSRSGGRFFLHDGKLVRPAQDCSLEYGGALNFREVTTLTSTAFEERNLQRLAPSVWQDAVGVHTYSRTASFEFIDRLLSLAPAS